jgi:glycosyltransferase involved in cell wall biosynthesis
MAVPTLSIVMPVHDEAPHLPQTIAALVAAVAGSPFDAELVVVDDGSTDGSAAVASGAVDGRLPARVVSQPNRGRFEARRAGLDAATGEHVLLLDARVRVREAALGFVQERLAEGRRVWTAHVDVDARGNPYGEFWKLLAELAWAEYFASPRDTSFGVEDFDRYPKGTTCFFAPRQLLRDAVAAFRSAYVDLRHANDDTPLIRWIAERERINVSPDFACDYTPRATLASFVRHSFHRGVVFLDGHGRRESRFFPALAAFYPASAVLAVAATRRPAVGAFAAAATSAGAAALGAAQRRSPSEIATLGLLAPVYAVAHGAGMWRGLALLTASRR